jgi:dihydrofolate reductase
LTKLTAFETISLDGYFTGANGDLSWAHEGSDPEFDAFVQQNASGSDGALLFGRVTYDMMVSYWPTEMAAKQQPKVAEGINRTKKFVFSRSMKEATWNNTTLIKDDVVATIRRMKDESGGGLTILGSGSIVSQLSEDGLIDEYQLVVKPVAIGQGRPLFEGMKRKLGLKLLKTRTFPSGIVLLVYGM